MGDLAAARSELPAAATRYRQALAIDPKLPEAVLGLAYVDTQDGDFAVAAPLLEQVIAADPTNALARYRLSVVYRKLSTQVDSTKTGTVYRELKLVFRNRHDGTFDDVSATSGAALRVPQVSRGVAVGDLFNRGRLNIVVENLVGGPMILKTRPNAGHHWISLQLEAAPSNRLALNARVRVTTGSFTQTGEVRSGDSYLSQNDLRLHFGLSDAATVDRIDVLWPSGRNADLYQRTRQSLLPPQAGRHSRAR